MQEHREDGRVCLTLAGELDLVSAPMLDDRLHQLRGTGTSVFADLSRLEFMDSRGLRVLVGAVNEGRREGWKLDIIGELSPQVRRLFALADAEHLLAGHGDAATGA